MNSPTLRLYFIDVIRAFAICMMLQGHFVDSLLADVYRDDQNIFYLTWKYLRGITAPIFFTVSGFIFTYLLIKEKSLTSWKNPRVRKGIRRGLILIGLGYLLRLNLGGLLIGELYDSLYMVDVLHCIGLSLLFTIALYAYSFQKKKYVFPALLLGSTLLIFILEPLYAGFSFDFLPKIAANYFTKANGSVFTIFPWFGYSAFGAFMSVLLHNYKERRYFYHYTIGITLAIGLLLMFLSPQFFWILYQLSKIPWVLIMYNTEYLFTRLGNVLVLFSLFMLLRNIITSSTIHSIGQNTLSIYIIHFVLLYGSLTGLGLYPFFRNSLPPYVIVPGALLFVLTTIYLSFQYNRLKPGWVAKMTIVKQEVLFALTDFYTDLQSGLARLKTRIAAFLGLVKN